MASDEIAFEIVDESEFPQLKRKRRSKYSGIVDAALKLSKGKVIKIKAEDVKVGSLRSLLHKEKGNYGIAESEGYVYIRKK